MTLEEQLAEQAKRGLLGLGLEQETAEQYAPWASLLAQFIPGVGEGVGVDNTVDAINDERYGDAAIEGGLTLLGAVPVVGDFAAAAIKGIRKAPIKAFDEAAWLKDNPRPEGRSSDRVVRNWQAAKNRAKAKADPVEAENRRLYQAEYRNKNKADLEEKAKIRREKNKQKKAEYDKQLEANETPQQAKMRRQRKAAEARARRQKEIEEGTIARRRAREASAASRKREVVRRATMPHSDKAKIDEIYRVAADASFETGIPHHVDHVIPLQGRNVSGLHHQDNLLVVPGAENLSKSNKFEPGKPPPRAGVRKARKLLKEIRDGKKK